MKIIHYQRWESPLGTMILAARDDSLAGLWFHDQKYFPIITPEEWWEEPTPVLTETQQQLSAYFAGRLRHFDLPLDPAGTEFQRSVWNALIAVPYGDTTTYGGLAKQIGLPKGAHAVGSAVGRNPISVIVPCHRALGSDGKLHGYAGGLARKTQLLDLEQGQLLIPLDGESASDDI